MSAPVKPKKRIAPTLVSVVPDATTAAAYQAKKNPLENAADLIAMRYGVSQEAPQIDESIFEQNRNVGKKVVPLKEYFKQAATEFNQKEAEKKEEVIKKKREYAKLTPCQRKANTLQRNLDGYIKDCDRTLSNEALIEMADKAREKAAKGPAQKAKRTAKRKVSSSASRASSRSSRSSLQGKKKK
jgi:hypothetical protein